MVTSVIQLLASFNHKSLSGLGVLFIISVGSADEDCREIEGFGENEEVRSVMFPSFSLVYYVFRDY